MLEKKRMSGGRELPQKKADKSKNVKLCAFAWK